MCIIILKGVCINGHNYEKYANKLKKNKNYDIKEDALIGSSLFLCPCSF